MVKFEKTFPQLQKKEWKSEYINYKALKHFIKVENTKEEKVEQKELIKQFVSLLNQEVKNVYLFYVQTEREIYIMINSHLHIRNTYDSMNLNSINNEVKALIDIISFAYDLLCYIKINMIAVQKILKKFDKKFRQYLKTKITGKYLSDKIGNENSDIVYIFQFKIINEVCALIEDLKFDLFAKYKSFLERSKKAIELNSKDNDSAEEILIITDVRNSSTTQIILNDSSQDPITSEIEITTNFSLIDIHIGKIERIFLQLKNIYRVWNVQLKYAIINNKNNFEDIFCRSTSEDEILKDLNKNSNENEDINLQNPGEKLKKTLTSKLISYENFSNVILTLALTLTSHISYVIILPDIFFIIDKICKSSSPSTFILLMLPISEIISFTYSKIWASNTIKLPMIVACIFGAVGNTIYVLGVHLQLIILLLVGRLIVGFSLNGEINRIYISTYIPKRKISKYLLFLKLSGMVGKVSGMIIVMISYFCFTHFESLAPSTICAIISLFMLILIVFFFTEPVDSKFNQYGENQSQSDHSSRMGSLSIESSLTSKDSETVKILNEKLKKLNDENQFTDTNLVTKTIDNIITRNKNKGKIFIYLLSLIIINKSMTFSFLFVSVAIITFNHSFRLPNVSIILLILFSLIIPIYLLNYFFLSKKFSSRILLIILLALILVQSVLYLIFLNNPDITIPFLFLFVYIGILIEDKAFYLFGKLVPFDYAPFCNMLCNIYVQLSLHIGTMIACFNMINKNILQQKKILLYITLGLYLIEGIITMILFKDLKERPISRLVRLRSTRKFKRTEF